MHIPVKSSFTGILILMSWLFPGYLALAQGITDPSQLPKNSFQWNQEERELGFLHFDEVFGGRDVPRGDNVHELPVGEPLPAFLPGGEKEKDLEKFISEQKVAGLFILQDGKIRYERYGLGLQESGRWPVQSIAKSVTSTLLGAAIKDGYIQSIDDFVSDYIPGLKGSAYDKVRIHHLLTMNTGVRWNESHTDPASDLRRFFTDPIEPGMDQTVSYMRKLPAEVEPGTRWVYKTGETHLLGVLVNLATGQSLSDYLSSKIWAPYGMQGKATWLLNQTGHELGGCCLQMCLRDLGRFGQFVLEGGHIEGESIVADNWFQSATHTQVPLWFGWGYGYQWWTMIDGTFRAIGVHGQMLHIDPERQLVIAIFSAWPEAESDLRRMAVIGFLNMVTKQIDKD
jgi:CubicO group peptidase (beta-lactamase class C family)